MEMNNYQLPITHYPSPIPKLVLLIGIPGSGKSSLAQQIVAASRGHLLISTDAIRGKLFGDEAIQGSWVLIWQELQQQFHQAVAAISQNSATEAIFDATNVVWQYRREAIAQARDTGFTHITGLWLDTPVWLCLFRNRRRQRIVPDDVILRMHRQLREQPPSLADGLDCLIRYYPGGCSTVGALAQVRKNRTRPNLHL
jgi:predicted kinase